MTMTGEFEANDLENVYLSIFLLKKQKHVNSLRSFDFISVFENRIRKFKEIE